MGRQKKITKKNDLVEKEIRVNVPRPLARKEVRDAISFGLFRLAGGSKPQNIPDSAELVTARVKLNATALKYLPLGIAKVGDERTAIIHALAWLAEQREHVLLTRI